MRTIWRADQLPRENPLYIFGAGQGGQALQAYLSRSRKHRPVAFLDNHKTGNLHGSPILTLDQFQPNHEPGAIVLIASQHVKEIARQLDDRGIRDWYNAHPCAMSLIDRDIRRKGRFITAAALLPVVLALSIFL
ncbi:nucleoside-diphosphate sugar epimerase/dehydratase [Azospirillum agricola]|uniref:nucleoside-diphosphate sugar epimerase/dehydratase n=1 Tax=Azospirillum agricola TaxID=1720247 RepID=UPI000A1C7EB8|nr:hypothetical protein [Azospirillum agricola]